MKMGTQGYMNVSRYYAKHEKRNNEVDPTLIRSHWSPLSMLIRGAASSTAVAIKASRHVFAFFASLMPEIFAVGILLVTTDVFVAADDRA
jgi:hypothetical protein